MEQSDPPDDAQIDAMVLVLNRVATPTSWFNAKEAIRAAAELPYLLDGTGGLNTSTDAVRLALLWALEYQIEIRRDSSSQKVVVAPRSTVGTLEQPPSVKTVQNDLADIWAALADRVNASFLQARFHHLLFERGGPRRLVHGLRAIAAYRDSSEQWERGFDQRDSLAFALRLSRALQRDESVKDISARLIECSRNVLSNEENLPGLALAFIDPLLEESNVDQQSIDDTLAAAHERYEADDHTVDSILRIQISRTVEEGHRLALFTERVARWIRAADATEGVLRAHWRKRALEIADESGSSALRARAAVELQKTKNEDLGMIRMTASSHTDQEQIERILAPIREAPSWQEGLSEFATFGPISGRLQDNMEHVRKSAQLSPLQAILPVEKIGGDGLPRFTASSTDEREAYALAKWEQTFIDAWCPWLATALQEVAATHGLPTEADLTDFFTEQPWANRDDAACLARSFHRFWAGDYEGCAYTVAPKIESVARELLLALDVGIYRLQRRQVPGQYPGLGALLDALHGEGLPTDWYRYIRTVCSAPEGMNLRNELAHGFIANISAAGAVLLLQAALFLIRIPISAQEVPSKAST